MTPVPGLAEICGAVAGGGVTATAAIRNSFERAVRVQPELQAFAFLPETAPEPGHGPMSGAAVGVKDLFDTADMPTAYGTTVLHGHRPAADAAIVARLRTCGATVLGKTVTTEFAYQHPGPTRNPWKLAHTPGGSSSGSAAAVAAGVVPLAFGTQTMGSVIRPAAYCGVIGFKPTFGTLPRDGAHPFCDALDHVGLFARSMSDIDFALRCLGAWPEVAPAAPRTFRFGLLPLADPTIEPGQRDAMRLALAVIRAAGHDIAEAAPPAGLDDVPAIIDTLTACEAGTHFGAAVSLHGERISAPIRALVARGRALGPTEYRAALAGQAAFRDATVKAAEPHDALLTIPAAGEAPEGLASTGDPRFCAPWSLAGVPALTIPIGFGPAGLPLGLQVVGHRGGDAAVLRVGAAIASLFPLVAPPPAYRQDFGNSM